MQYIRSFPPYLEGVSSISNLRTRHAMVTKDPPNMVLVQIFGSDDNKSKPDSGGNQEETELG
jgi:hypothetical protein